MKRGEIASRHAGRVVSTLLLCLWPAAAHASSWTVQAGEDTSINSRATANNNGGLDSLFTGLDNKLTPHGVLKSLIKFTVPGALSNLTKVTSVQVTIFYHDLPDVAHRFDGSLSLQRITVGWNGGTSANDALMGRATGAACAGAGATWNTSNCSTAWSAGAPVSATTYSGATFGSPGTFGKVDGSGITWSSPACTGLSNTMCSDVQNWLDGGTNTGWRVSSSTEGGAPVATGCTTVCPAAQRYYSFNAGNSSLRPRLVINFTTCTDNANTACKTSLGNTCNDAGSTDSIPVPSYTCTCGTGFSGSGGQSCTDINDCSGNPCASNGDSAATCLDNAAPGPRGRTCGCTTGSGFLLSGTNGTLSATCVSGCTAASSKTSSDPCKGTGNPTTNFCTPGSPGTWSCTCASGWVATTGTNQPTCADFPGCTSGGGNTSCKVTQSGGINSCSDVAAPSLSWNCGCSSPAYDGNNTTSCTEHNPCLSTPNPCTQNGDTSASCNDVAAPGTGQTCGCTSGFNLSGVNGTTSATCVSNCTAATTKTVNDPCVGTGSPTTNFCTPGVAGAYSCTCASGWIASGGSFPTCANFNACTMGSGNASCLVSQSGNINACADANPSSLSWTCSCSSPAYDGNNTTACSNHNACSPTDPCRAGGDVGSSERCNDVGAPGTGYTCTCDTGFTSVGGTCQNACHTGANPCNTNGDSASTCALIGSGGWSCACTAGYQAVGGITPTCVNIDACTTIAQTACVSLAGNSCVDENPSSTTYHCNCSNAAYVPNTGNPTSNSRCIDKNECSPNHCKDGGNNGAICTDHVAPDTGYDCTCSSETLWTLVDLNNFLTCIDTDECAGGNPCLHGKCTNVPLGGGYKCECDAGYILIDGVTAVPHCEHPSSCDVNAEASCVQTQGGNFCVDQPPPKIDFECQCGNPAYILSNDHRSCVNRNGCEIDHCGDGGNRHALCVDRRAPKAGYDCECGAGWKFDGTTCIDVNECLSGSNPCGHGDCSNTAGGYQCLCSDGYIQGKKSPITCVPGTPSNYVWSVVPGSCSVAGGPDPGALALLLLAGLLLWRRSARTRRP